MAGQEGFEPPTPGFGVRRSTVRATGLHNHTLITGSLALNRIYSILFPCEAYGFGRIDNTCEIQAYLEWSVCFLWLYNFSAYTLCRQGSRSLSQVTPLRLFDNITDHTGAHGPSTFTNRKPHLFLHGDRRDQLRTDRYIVPGHHHLHSLR